ncbi:MAG: Hsp20/alpha crystallin family protein [Planctomycetota bacterium]|jgi:HSP20 family molecular chaperone IbpA
MMNAQLNNCKERECNSNQAGVKAVKIPDLDIVENKDSFEIYADMPGAGDTDIEIVVEKNLLKISGSVSESDRVYKRSFFLPDDLDKESISANIKDGVLSIHLPKSEDKGIKKIFVKNIEN